MPTVSNKPDLSKEYDHSFKHRRWGIFAFWRGYSYDHSCGFNRRWFGMSIKDFEIEISYSLP